MNPKGVKQKTVIMNDVMFDENDVPPLRGCVECGWGLCAQGFTPLPKLFRRFAALNYGGAYQHGGSHRRLIIAPLRGWFCENVSRLVFAEMVEWCNFVWNNIEP